MRYWTDYLVHYGVMGMKWGVRRYLNEDGTLTAEGRARYGSVNNLKRDYQDQVYTNAQAMRIESSGHGYKSKSAGKSGMMYARIKEGNNDPDAYLYRGAQLQGKKTATEKSFTTKDKMIKIASVETGRQVYNNLMKNDPDFKKEVTAIHGSKEAQLALKQLPYLAYTDDKKSPSYDNFNVELVTDKMRGSTSAQKFQNEVQKLGYNGVVDLYDTRHGAYQSKTAAIVFSNTMKENGSKTLSSKEVKKYRAEGLKQWHKNVGNQISGVQSLANKGYSVQQIADKLNVPMEIVIPMYYGLTGY